MVMNTTSVVSSMIDSIGYDPDIKTLEVTMLSGDTYDYYEVPQEVYDAFINAPSAGRFFDDYIKGVYAYD